MITTMIIVFSIGLLFLLFADTNGDGTSDITGFLLIILSFTYMTVTLLNESKIDLPEQYESITEEDNLKGYFDDEDILHIEFNN